MMGVVLQGKEVQAQIDISADCCVIDLALCLSLPGVVIDRRKTIQIQLMSSYVWLPSPPWNGLAGLWINLLWSCLVPTN